MGARAANRAQTVARIAIMVSLASVLHAVEALIPVPYVVPGAKLGLANVVALYAVATLGLREALAISFLRTLLGSLITGTFLNTGYYIGTAGALASTLMMSLVWMLFHGHVSVVGVSVIGAVTHNLAQLLTAVLLLRTTGVLFYLPYLLLFAIPTGVFVGFVCKRVLASGRGSGT